MLCHNKIPHSNVYAGHAGRIILNIGGTYLQFAEQARVTRFLHKDIYPEGKMERNTKQMLRDKKKGSNSRYHSHKRIVPSSTGVATKYKQ